LIYYSIPYSLDKNIGEYYNSFMECLPSDTDFACFIDGDVSFTTNNFGTQIESIIKRYSDGKFFTCYTNRVGFQRQIFPGVNIHSNDMEYHRFIGKKIQESFWDECEDLSYLQLNELISGMLLLIRKDLWKSVGGFLNKGMLGVDNDFHLKCILNKEKLYLMKGIYVYHWYRWPNQQNINHLK
jgi:hypothetical protein